MGLPFVTRAASAAELEFLTLMIKTFGDGSGNHREVDGRSRAAWRELERVVAEFLTGKKHSEDKHVFDVIARDWADVGISYGLSIKSKKITGRKSIFAGYNDPRAYLELSNSPAKMWASIARKTGAVAAEFPNVDAQAVGDALIETIGEWKFAAKREFERDYSGEVLDLDRSTYLTFSFSDYESGTWRYNVASFPMKFPTVQWFCSSDRCLSANDPDQPECRLLDWYPNSGGQLKYYPRFASATHMSDIMTLTAIDEIAIVRKTLSYFERASELLGRLTLEQIALIRNLGGEVSQ